MVKIRRKINSAMNIKKIQFEFEPLSEIPKQILEN